MGAVWRLVGAEADVSVRPVDPPITPVRREVGEELLHWRSDDGLVDGFVLLPVGLRVIGLQALEELQCLRWPASERHRCHPRSSCPSSAPSEKQSRVLWVRDLFLCMLAL